jgi:hypothetical protein
LRAHVRHVAASKGRSAVCAREIERALARVRALRSACPEDVMKSTFVISAAIVAVAVTAGVSARSDEKKNEEKYCEALTAFHSDMKSLESLGPKSTIAEVKAAAARIEDAGEKVVKTAHKVKTPTAKQFTDATKQLKKDAKSIPDTATVEQAHARLKADRQAIEDSARKIATESGCPMPEPAK